MSTDTPRPEPRCKHIYPGGERCSLPADTHESVVGLADLHGYPPADSPSTPRPERVTLADALLTGLHEAGWFARADLDPDLLGGIVHDAADIAGEWASAREEALREENARYQSVAAEAARWVALADRYPSRDVYSTGYVHTNILRSLVAARGETR